MIKYDCFHNSIILMRRELQVIRTKRDRKTYATKWDLNIDESCLVAINLALNIILSHSSDSTHNEYNDMIKQLHLLLMKTILTIVASKKYNKQLRQWSFSSKYARLQSLVHYLKSYSLVEYVRWSIIVSTLFRLWLRKKHIQFLFLHKLKQLLDCKNRKTIVTIVKCFACLTKSNNVLMTKALIEENRQNLNFIV